MKWLEYFRENWVLTFITFFAHLPLEVIYEFHKEMVKQFRNKIEDWNEEKTQLSDIFINLVFIH